MVISADFDRSDSECIQPFKKVNADDDEDIEEDEIYIRAIQEDVPWNFKEQLLWGTLSVISFIIFIIL